VEEGSTQQKPDKRYESGDEELKITRCTRSVKYQNINGASCLKIQTGDTMLSVSWTRLVPTPIASRTVEQRQCLTVT